MSNPAPVGHPILDALRDRWSPRAFADTPVHPAQLHRLFEAARWAASSYNEQPWRFIIATADDTAGFQKLLSCLADANQAWAKAAPVLGLTIAKEAFTKNGKPNRCCEHDIGLAMGNLSAQATAEGLVVHQMAGIDQDRCRQVYGIPEGYHAFSAFAIGHVGDPASLPQDWMREAEAAPRTRMSFDEFIFADAFGQASPLFR